MGPRDADTIPDDDAPEAAAAEDAAMEGPAAAAAAERSVDGRTARRDRNRDAVLRAVNELFTEDNLSPGPAQVAERSGVSLRSVYRYFEDGDALMRAAIEWRIERVASLYRISAIGEGSLAGRVDALVEQRLRLYEEVAPAARAMMLRAPGEPVLRQQLERRRRWLRDQIDRQFAAELAVMDDPRRLAMGAAADALCQFEGIEHLRRHRRLSVARTAAVLRGALLQLLSPAAATAGD